MKIKKSILEKIIKEELRQLVEQEESWKDVFGHMGREFMKGFAGSGKGDNPISRYAHQSMGSGLVPSIDKIFKQLSDRAKELKSYDFEPGQIVDPKNPRSNASQAQIVDNFNKALQKFIMEEWISMTPGGRENMPQPEAPPEEADLASPEGKKDYEERTGLVLPEQNNIAEVIRQEVRAALRERS